MNVSFEGSRHFLSFWPNVRCCCCCCVDDALFRVMGSKKNVARFPRGISTSSETDGSTTIKCNHFIIRSKVTRKQNQLLKLLTSQAGLPLCQSGAGLLSFYTLLGQTNAVNLNGNDINCNCDNKLQSLHH